MGILETCIYPSLADRWFQSDLFQQSHYHREFVTILKELYCTQCEGVQIQT